MSKDDNGDFDHCLALSRARPAVASRAAGEEEEEEVMPKLCSFSPKLVAEEMTLLDAGLLRLIKTSELENGVWMKKDKVAAQSVQWCRKG